MSFTRLLAAGRSIMGIRKGPGPYRMNPGSLLPNFAAVPKVVPGAAPAKPVGELGDVPARRLDQKANHNESSSKGEIGTDPKMTASQPGQAGNVATPRRQPLGMVWNRLSAHLLRKAAQEFSLMQKERGKLL